MLNRLQPILIAGLLPLLVFSWFTSTVTEQIDFWLLWLVAMLLVGLPMVFAEIALAHRSGNNPLVGLPKLTREADVSTFWRLFGWLTIILLSLVNAHLLNSSSDLLHHISHLASPVLLAILLLVMMALSFLRHFVGWFALLLAVVGLASNVGNINLSAWQMTSVSTAEWSLALVLALVSVGAGTGLFWHTRSYQLLLSQNTDKKQWVASRTVLPIWGLQLLVGSLMAANSSLSPNPTALNLSQMCYLLAMMAGSGYLLHLLAQQIALHLKQKPFDFLTLVLLSVLTFLFALLPNRWLNQILILTSFITAVWLAIFVGWQMKISHLRKSLNFSSEITYNLWRIAMRIVIPLAIVIALLGWLKNL